MHMVRYSKKERTAESLRRKFQELAKKIQQVIQIFHLTFIMQSAYVNLVMMTMLVTTMTT
jgi:hypothetical protein